MESLFSRFWHWYERHYLLNLTVATGLFLLQLVHLYWLGTDVIAERLLGEGFFRPTPFWQYIIIAVDYTEIPALISTSVLYAHEFRMGLRQFRKFLQWKSVIFLFCLNIQWLHLFWITDEFVVSAFRGGEGTVLPLWLAWVAIVIDYLEVPVIIDTIVKLIRAFVFERWIGFWKEMKWHWFGL
jgi:hypothetical protein